MKKLTLIQIISVSMMLFAIFFWCRQHDFSSCYGTAGWNELYQCPCSFILTDAGIAILGVTAVVLAGTSMSDLGNLSVGGSLWFYRLVFIC